MVKKEKSIQLLNEGVADEMQAIHQYMYWHFHLDDQGFGPLATMFKQIAIIEMGHVELLAERILFLKGDVDLVPAGPVQKITEPEKILNTAAKMEEGAVELYNRAALELGANGDSTSRQVVERLVAEEEGHFDQFDTQLDNIRRFGPNYLALQSFGRGTEAGGEPAE